MRVRNHSRLRNKPWLHYLNLHWREKTSKWTAIFRPPGMSRNTIKSFLNIENTSCEFQSSTCGLWQIWRKEMTLTMIRHNFNPMGRPSSIRSWQPLSMASLRRWTSTQPTCSASTGLLICSDPTSSSILCSRWLLVLKQFSLRTRLTRTSSLTGSMIK